MKRTTIVWNDRRPRTSLCAAFVLFFLSVGFGGAGLIVNELFRGQNQNSDYIEFLVTSDITLADLDGIWFGDSKSNTKGVDHENKFNATQIISNVGAFNSTADVLRAGTILTVGGSSVTTDFAYNPDSSDPTNSDGWNITLSAGQGFNTTSGGPAFKLDQNGDVVWVGTSQPSSGSGVTDFLSAIAYDSSPGGLAQQVQSLAAGGNGSFQLATGPGFDGKLNKNLSLSNNSGAVINFGETSNSTFGEGNGGANLSFTYDLRAVPEPSAILPCLFVLGIGVYFGVKKNRPSTQEA